MSPGASEIPTGWIQTNLGEIVTLSRKLVDPDEAGDAHYLSLEHIEPYTNRILPHGTASGVRSAKSLFHAGDVLYGRLRPYLNKVCLPDFDGICSTDVLVLRPSPVVSGEYLLYYLSQPWVAEYAHNHSTGVNLPRVNFETLARLPISLPPIEEQHHITRRLASIRGHTYRTRSLLDEADSLLHRYRMSVMRSATQGDMSRPWRKSNPDAAAPKELLLESDQREPSLFGDMSPPVATRDGKDGASGREEELPGLPETWRWAYLEEIANVKVGLKLGRKQSGDKQFQDVPYLRVANVQRGFLDLQEVLTTPVTPEEFEALRLKSGDILVTEGGDRDKLGRGWVWSEEIDGCIHQNHVYRARVTVKGVDPRFVSWYANSHGQRYFLRRAKHSTNLASISLAVLSKLPVPIPPPEEASAVCELVEQAFGRIEAVGSMLAEARGHLFDLEQRTFLLLLRSEGHGGRVVRWEGIGLAAGPNASGTSMSTRDDDGKRAGGRRRGVLRPYGAGQKAMTLAKAGPTYLTDLLDEHDGSMSPEALWRSSKLAIDDFYAQLKREVDAGTIRVSGGDVRELERAT